jgi:hypothetical protein
MLGHLGDAGTMLADILFEKSDCILMLISHLEGSLELLVVFSELRTQGVFDDIGEVVLLLVDVGLLRRSASDDHMGIPLLLEAILELDMDRLHLDLLDLDELCWDDVFCQKFHQSSCQDFLFLARFL